MSFMPSCILSSIKGITLIQRDFVLNFDNEVLRYLNSQRNLNKCHAKWSNFLQEYTFTLHHKSGALSMATYVWVGESHCYEPSVGMSYLLIPLRTYITLTHTLVLFVSLVSLWVRTLWLLIFFTLKIYISGWYKMQLMWINGCRIFRTRSRKFSARTLTANPEVRTCPNTKLWVC